MRIHPLVLAAMLATASMASTDALVIPIVMKSTTTKRRISSNSDIIFQKLESKLADVSHVTSFATSTSTTSTSLLIGDSSKELRITEAADEFQERKAAEITTSNAQLSNTKSETSSSSPGERGERLSTLSLRPGALAGASFSIAALGGLAVARSMLSQRQKKIDEEKQTLEEQQKRLETETTNLQKEKFQNNNLLLVRNLYLSN